MSTSKNNEPYWDERADIEKRVENLLSLLTVDEKISLLSKYTGFSTRPIDRLGIPEFKMTDGPHGVRKSTSDGKKNTYFPSAVGMASTWNRKLMYRYGEVLAEETRAAGRHCILGPGINIHRSPLCGRNFEYFTEDPYLNSEMVVPMVKGIQSKKIAACVKHFVCNNSEIRRRFSDSVVDERTLHEIYLPGFKAAVERAKPWSIMGSYNLVNGEYVYVQRHLLIDLLRETWGFDGFVVSDWWATHNLIKPEECIKGGLTLEMPKDMVYNQELTKAAYEENKFTESDLDRVIAPLLRTIFRVGLMDRTQNSSSGVRNTQDHKDIAYKIVCEGTVLLKNEEKILPINPENEWKICITGPFAKRNPLFPFAAGSSYVTPPIKSTYFGEFKKVVGDKCKIVRKPEEADLVLYFTGKKHFFHGHTFFIV